MKDVKEGNDRSWKEGKKPHNEGRVKGRKEERKEGRKAGRQGRARRG